MSPSVKEQWGSEFPSETKIIQVLSIKIQNIKKLSPVPSPGKPPAAYL
jgi:hypothetical protein